MVSVRPAKPDDTPQIRAFIAALAAYERLAHEVTGTVDELREQLFGARPAAEVMIAEDDGRPIGFALFFANFSTFKAKPGLYLEDLFVYPEHRGKGAGKALLVELARVAAKRNYGRMEWSVLDWNEPSIQFYKSLGAIPMDEWTTYRMSEEAFRKLAFTTL